MLVGPLAAKKMEGGRCSRNLLQFCRGSTWRVTVIGVRLFPMYPKLAKALESRYQIEREIGAGGMATVFLARDVRHHRNVALKVLKPDLGAVLGGERFLAE